MFSLIVILNLRFILAEKARLLKEHDDVVARCESAKRAFRAAMKMLKKVSVERDEALKKG